MDGNSVYTVLIALMVSIVAPSLLAWLNGIQARRARQDEYKRQDEVALRLEERQDAAEARAREVVMQAEEAARLLVERQDASEARQDAAARRAVEVANQASEAADLLLAANERVAAQTAEAARRNLAELAEIRAQGKSIHTLVDGAMTEAKQAQLTALVNLIGVTEEMHKLLRAAGSEPTPAALEALEETERTAVSLRSELAEREVTAKLIEAEAASAVADAE